MKNIKLLAAAGMLSVVSFSGFAQSVSVTADTLNNAEAKIAAICYQRCKTDPPQRLKIDPGVNLLL
ncbi:hypothetical protein ACK8OV_21830 [Enterobacter kobei]|uniref:hypothetical protein n=1 Tax=Enterobacter kobei TaxID=208224 RepID=UPI00397857F8